MIIKDNCDTQRLLFSLDYSYTKSHGEMKSTAYIHTYPTN